MKKWIMVTFILITAAVSPALAGDYYLIIVDGLSSGNQAALEGWPGRAWGKTADRAYLFGDDINCRWLDDRNIGYNRILFNDPPRPLYLCSGISDFDKYADQILDRSDSYILTKSKIPGARFCRKLNLRKLPFGNPESHFTTDVLDYHPTIDSLIGLVSQDSLYDFLTRLTGEAPIEIDGRIDTIKTRYSGTDDNILAAEYLTQTLEGYGYPTRYHVFFNGNFRNLAIYDGTTAWAVDASGDGYRTTDGIHWGLMNVWAFTSLWGIANAGRDSVWVVGNGGCIRVSFNGGNTWNDQNSGTTENLWGIFMLNAQTGWLTGSRGMIRRTQNGGMTWLEQNTPTSNWLLDICFVDADYGWAVGDYGTILHTTDGGLNWIAQTSGISNRLYDVNFLDRNNGWAVGWNGSIVYTHNGGQTWNLVNFGDTNERQHVAFTNIYHGCIVGWDGDIFYTFDGGQQWNRAESGTRRDLYTVEFVDDHLGYAAGEETLLKTTDGGMTWTNVTIDIDEAQRNVIATKPGTTHSEEQVIICGHFDNRSEMPLMRATGADDNGSGVMAVLEAARLFTHTNFERTIKFCLWSGEEQGLVGSGAYAADAYEEDDDIVGVYNFDMIAWDGNGDNLGQLHCGTTYASNGLGNIFEDVVDDYDIDMVIEHLTSGSTDRSDHASFWEYNYPAILGIEDFNDFNPYYHTLEDNMTHLDRPYFFEYVKAALGATATLAIPDTAVTGINEPVELPDTYLLARSYPNPFNASTVISFNLPERSQVRLTVYDLLGRETAVLVDDVLHAGEHDAIWRADNYSSGIYFYRLKTENESVIGKMVLLK
jgi:photosystem II stability/assembly factor-like uncharacterized protein